MARAWPRAWPACARWRPSPPALEALIVRALAKEPAQRQQSMEELAAVLDQVARQIAPSMFAGTAAISVPHITPGAGYLPQPTPAPTVATAPTVASTPTPLA